VSIGSTDNVMGGNTDCNVRQTALDSAVLATHQSCSRCPSDGEAEGKVGLDHYNGPSDWINWTLHPSIAQKPNRPLHHQR